MKHSLLFFIAFCFFILKTRAQAKWNCGEKGAANVVATFDGTTQTLSISGKGKMVDYSSKWNIPWIDLKDAIKIVKINQGVTNIGDNAFSQLSNLETVDIANSVIVIGDGAFYQAKNLRKINIPNSVTTIRNFVFRGTGIENISIPLSVKVMGSTNFADCSSLKTVDLSKTHISDIYTSFSGCEQLESVYLPSTITVIGESTFAFCKSLKSITCYSSTPPKLSESAFEIINRDEGKIDISLVTLYVPEASLSVYKYSNTWKSFGKIEAIPKR